MQQNEIVSYLVSSVTRPTRHIIGLRYFEDESSQTVYIGYTNKRCGTTVECAAIVLAHFTTYFVNVTKLEVRTVYETEC